MGGVQQIASLSMARRWTPVPGAFYLVPALILIAGIVALFNPTGARNTDGAKLRLRISYVRNSRKG